MTAGCGVGGGCGFGQRDRGWYADRTDAVALTTALGDDTWDVVIDTWSQETAAVGVAARALSGRAVHYSYVSSRSVYTWPIPAHSGPMGTGGTVALLVTPIARGGRVPAPRPDTREL
jgi:hypothetical protein